MHRKFYANIMETFYYKETVNILKNASNLDSVGGRIKYYRLVHKLIQQKVADRANIDVSTIKRYENNLFGPCEPSLNICNKISRGIGVDPKLIYDEYLTFVASDYGNKIKKLRKKLRLTQKELGRSIGVHRKTIMRWEKGMAFPLRNHYFALKDMSSYSL